MQTKIIKGYKKISDFVFHYLIFLVALVIAILIFQGTISQSTTIIGFQTNDVLLEQKNKLISDFDAFLTQNIKDHNTQIQILQGDFETDKGFIKSVNNLITYEGFVVPRYFYLYSTIPVKPISYFSGGTYDTSELENFVNTFIFTKKISINKSFVRVQLPLTNTLVDNFNLSCVFGSKLSKNTCNHYLSEFLNSFFVYNIAIDYIGLNKIFDAIKDVPSQKTRFCEGLSKYFLYSNDKSLSIKKLFGMCGTTYDDVFKRTTLFMEIQKTLETQSFEKVSYKDTLLNAYKLLSYQQNLYQDFLINKVDTYKIHAYLDFVKEILKKNSIEQFYKDEIYRYNNHYLFSTLEKIAYQSNSFSQNFGSSKIASLLTAINTLNDGEPLFGFSGLTLEIQNPSLIPQKETATGINMVLNQAERIQKKLQNISYLSIEKQDILGTGVDIIGYLKFFSPDQNETIKAHIIMEYKNDILLVRSINLQNKPEINDVIKNLLLIQNFSIGELYSYISKNLVFYEQANAPINTNTELCPSLALLTDISVISCTNTTVTLTKGTIRYDIMIKNGGIENISVSDKSLENLIKTSYSTIVGNTYVLLDTIKALLAYTATTEGHEGTTNAIVVFEKIQQYLGIKANDIADNSGMILIDISLGGINFVVKYTLTTNTLGPWYFKDIRINNKPYLIQNLNLVLDDTHQNSINSFVIDPLTAIKSADITARQNYQAFFAPQK